jgi:hypothetical protein
MRNHGTIFAAILAAATLLGTPMAARADVIVRVGPPEARVEVVPPERHGYRWAPGYWRWYGGKYVWAAGHWMRDRPGWRWEPDAWRNGPDGWHYVPGHWAR